MGVNVFHTRSTGDLLPYQLAPGGEDHNQYMARAGCW